MKKKSELTKEYQKLCKKLFDIRLRIDQIVNNAVCVCDDCKTVIEEFDPTRVYKEENRQIYDKWERWYYLCDCGTKIYLTGDLYEFFRKNGTSYREWLEKYSFPFDEIHLVQYGATKANSTRKNGGFQIIVDDNAEVRKGWHLGGTIDANKDILSELIALYLAEVA